MSPRRRPCSWGPLDTGLNKGEASRAGRRVSLVSVFRTLPAGLAYDGAASLKTRRPNGRRKSDDRANSLGNFLESTGWREEFRVSQWFLFVEEGFWKIKKTVHRREISNWRWRKKLKTKLEKIRGWRTTKHKSTATLTAFSLSRRDEICETSCSLLSCPFPFIFLRSRILSINGSRGWFGSMLVRKKAFRKHFKSLISSWKFRCYLTISIVYIL